MGLIAEAKRIKEKASLEIIYKIIDSNEPCLFIGSMTSQKKLLLKKNTETKNENILT